MTDIHRKRVIDLDPYEVRDETLAALKEEIHAQANVRIDDIDIVDTLVLDSKRDGGLDSHATIFTVDSSDGGE